jgi:hypothetical protein
VAEQERRWIIWRDVELATYFRGEPRKGRWFVSPECPVPPAPSSPHPDRSIEAVEVMPVSEVYGPLGKAPTFTEVCEKLEDAEARIAGLGRERDKARAERDALLGRAEHAEFVNRYRRGEAERAAIRRQNEGRAYD